MSEENVKVGEKKALS